MCEIKEGVVEELNLCQLTTTIPSAEYRELVGGNVVKEMEKKELRDELYAKTTELQNLKFENSEYKKTVITLRESNKDLSEKVLKLEEQLRDYEALKEKCSSIMGVLGNK